MIVALGARLLKHNRDPSAPCASQGLFEASRPCITSPRRESSPLPAASARLATRLAQPPRRPGVHRGVHLLHCHVFPREDTAGRRPLPGGADGERLRADARR
eukprot:6562478-Prymnesium_polylepis.3